METMDERIHVFSQARPIRDVEASQQGRSEAMTDQTAELRDALELCDSIFETMQDVGADPGPQVAAGLNIIAARQRIRAALATQAVPDIERIEQAIENFIDGLDHAFMWGPTGESDADKKALAQAILAALAKLHTVPEGDRTELKVMSEYSAAVEGALQELHAAAEPFAFLKLYPPDPVERYDEETPILLHWPARKGHVPTSRLTIGNVAKLRKTLGLASAAFEYKPPVAAPSSTGLDEVGAMELLRQHGQVFYTRSGDVVRVDAALRAIQIASRGGVS